MVVELVAQTFVNGLNIGALYGMAAVGLSLTFGVMKILNVGHGEFLMVGGYIAFWLLRLWGGGPVFGLAGDRCRPIRFWSDLLQAPVFGFGRLPGGCQGKEFFTGWIRTFPRNAPR